MKALQVNGSPRITSLLIVLFTIALSLTGCGNTEWDDDVIRTQDSHTFFGYPVVYSTSDVSSKGLMSVYQALEASTDGNVAIRLSSISSDSGFLWSELLEDLARFLDSYTIVENDTETDFSGYDCTIVLSHFERNDHTGFSGAIANVAEVLPGENAPSESNHEIMEALAEQGKNTIDLLKGPVLYIGVLDSWSILDGTADTADIAIVSSYDPVALDQACIDLVSVMEVGASFAGHINSCEGIRTLVYAEALGMGSRTYALLSIDI